jgi:hypothetical protein
MYTFIKSLILLINSIKIETVHLLQDNYSLYFMNTKLIY